MGKKLLSLGAIAMDIVINSHDLPKDDGFALINQEQMLPGRERFQCIRVSGALWHGVLSDRQDWR